MKLFVALLVLCFVGLISAQECVNGCDAGLSICGGINYPLYVKNGTTNADTIALEAQVLKLIYALKNYGEPNCEAALHVFMCNVLHPSCDGNIATPAAPCIDMCTSVRTRCAAYLPIFPPNVLKHLNCSATNPSTGLPTYSSDNSTCSRVTSRVNQCTANPLPPVLPYTGTCQPFLGAKLGKLGALCAPFVTSKVYVPFDWPLAQLAVATRGGQFDAVEGGKPIFPYGCYKRLLATRCQVSFPPCTDVQVPDYNNVTAGIYPRPCINVCEEVNDYCRDFFLDIGLSNLIYNCSARYFNSISNYTTQVTAKTSFTLPCYREYIHYPDAVGTYNFTDVKCPNSTGRKTQAKDDNMSDDRLPLCGLKCPDASYSESEWQRLVNITRIGSALSLAAMTFLLVTYLLQFERRQFPVNLHIWEFIATGGFAISFLIGGHRPQESTWCYDEGTSATQSNNSTCATQGFFFIFFGLSLSVWCASIAFTMFYGIVLNKKVQDIKHFHYIFHLLSWGLPMIFAVAAVASHSIGYGPPLAWCFIHFNGFGYGDGLSRDYPLFYIGEGVLFLVILVFFVATVIKIVQVQKTSSFGNSKKMAAHSRTFKAQIRLLIFIFVVGIICFTIFEWRLQIDGDDKQSAVGIKWAMCKVKHEVGLATKADAGLCDGNVNPSRINYHHTAFESFLLSGIGILIFVAFGSDVGVYNHWIKMVKLVYAKRWKELVEFVRHGRDPFPSSQSNVTPTKISNRNSSLSSGNSNSSHKSSMDTSRNSVSVSANHS